MSSLVLCQGRNSFDKYATAKSNGQLFLSAGLLADTIKDLYIVSVSDKEIETVLWHLLLALLITCLLLELVGMGLSLYLSMQVYPCRTAEGVVISEGPTCRVAPSYGGTEAGDTWAAPREDDMPECPKHMKAINDTLTAVTFILMTLHAVKSALEGAAEESHRDKTSS